MHRGVTVEVKKAKPWLRSLNVYGCPFELPGRDLEYLLEGYISGIEEIKRFTYRDYPTIENGTRQIKYRDEIAEIPDHIMVDGRKLILRRPGERINRRHGPKEMPEPHLDRAQEDHTEEEISPPALTARPTPPPPRPSKNAKGPLHKKKREAPKKLYTDHHTQ